MTDHHCEDRPLSDFEHQLKSMTPALGHLLPAEVFYRAGWNAAVAALEDTPVNCVSSGVNREGLCGRPDVCQTRMDRAAEVGGGSGERRLDGCDRGTHRRLKAFATGGGIFAAGLACGLLLMIGMGTLGDSRASVDSDATQSVSIREENVPAVSDLSMTDVPERTPPVVADASTDGSRFAPETSTGMVPGADLRGENIGHLSDNRISTVGRLDRHALSKAAQTQWDLASQPVANHPSVQNREQLNLLSAPPDHPATLTPLPLTEEVLREWL
ncbi:MAG: hypothetical protein KDA96_10315 [Planctomycetaceae bacterium]|nr:hypothetical protein [Planctomycetaceae bacterium]